MNTELHIIPVTGIGEIPNGTDLGLVLYTALRQQNLTIENGDVFIVTQKIVSKAEGRVVNLDEVEPSAFAQTIAQQGKKDAQHIEVVLRESKRIVRMDHGVLISETWHGFICANAGVDESNVNGQRELTLLPIDADRSAQTLRRRLQQLASKDGEEVDIVVIISDTWGRPWRNGQVNMAIAVADELASAGELVMGKIDRIPVALIRGYTYIPAPGDGRTLIRDSATDLFR
jgi:coenzyme F420-0:L-glutamate ligase/coenzyme F420-1:gamma-L-glutamate ligase